MSVKVDLTELAGQLDSYGFAYLMTVSDELRAHVVAVRPVLTGGRLEVEGLGRGTRGNLVARPNISLVWPPPEPGGYSLIVDGVAEVTEAGAVVVPGHAVLHRPADHAPGQGDPAASGAVATGCGNDCVPLES
jgi:hypothetical protein